jgi:hypothetical protein
MHITTHFRLDKAELTPLLARREGQQKRRGVPKGDGFHDVGSSIPSILSHL